ncbi:hypothetical protein K443DRAFT_109647, partial [Laccaria amethystina LaAM-08-1]
FRKLREGVTIFVSWEKWPKKAGAYSKKEIDTERGKKNQKMMLDFMKIQKRSWTRINSTNTTMKRKKVYISI